MNKGNKLYEGKAKIIYETKDKNLVIQHFKDDATAFNNLKKSKVEGKGVLNNRISEYILTNLAQCGIKTHLVKRLNMREQLIRKAEIFPIEFIVRNIATGSLSKRLDISEGTVLEKPLLEYCYKNDDLGLVLEIINKSVAVSREEYDEPSTSKPPLKISSVWKESREKQLALALDASAVVANALGNADAALTNSEEAYQLTNKQNKQVNEHYAEVLFKNGSLDGAKKILEESIASGIQSPKMEEFLKQIFVTSQGSDAGFTSYYSDLKTQALDDLKAKIQSEMVTQLAPSFTLTDTDGKEVSLSDYKGKIVILDFWATWCGPCKASFPAMKKALNKYEKGNEVKILFVNSKETAEDKLQAVKDLMEKNNYPFHVLMDNKNEVFESYGVTLLPTKLIIDKAGNIRHRSFGFRGETELLDELEAVISILNS